MFTELAWIQYVLFSDFHFVEKELFELKKKHKTDKLLKSINALNAYAEELTAKLDGIENYKNNYFISGRAYICMK